MPIEITGNEHDDTFVETVGLDGSKKTMSGVFYGYPKRIEEEKRVAKAAPVKLWEGTVAANGGKVWLAPSVDRHLLLYMMVQNKKWHPIQVARFGELPASPPQPAQIPHNHLRWLR